MLKSQQQETHLGANRLNIGLKDATFMWFFFNHQPVAWPFRSPAARMERKLSKHSAEGSFKNCPW